MREGMRILVMGGEGNMGKRYCAILRHLGVEPIVFDIGCDIDYDGDFDGIIIATPTDTHLEILDSLITYDGPILCEKPLDTNVSDVGHAMKEYISAGMKLRMVDQYKYCAPDANPQNHYRGTIYNYHMSGKDGLEWDCINIVYHSETEPALSNSSPIWACMINGKSLTREEVDSAYIHMIKDWLEDGSSDYMHILKSHEKVQELINGKSLDRDPGSDYIH